MKIVKGFFWFAALTVLLDCIVASVPSLAPVRKSVVPLTGTPASIPYVFPICLWPGLLARGRAEMEEERVAAHIRYSAGVLLVFAAIGACAFAYFGGAHYSRSPWLRISAWRPLWTVVLPAGWAFVLLLAVGRTAETATRADAPGSQSAVRSPSLG